MSREPELGPAYDGSPTVVNIAASVLYDLAYELASEAWDTADEEEER